MIDRVSNDQLGFLSLKICCMRNQFCCGRLAFEKQESYVSIYRQLQTPSLDMFRQFVWAILPVLQIFLISCRYTISNNPFKENNRILFLLLHQSEGVNILKIKLQRIKRKLRGDNKNIGGGLIKMECSILFRSISASLRRNRLLDVTQRSPRVA